MEQSTVEELRHIFQVLLQTGLPVPLALMSISCWSTSASLPVQVLQKSMSGITQKYKLKRVSRNQHSSY